MPSYSFKFVGTDTVTEVLELADETAAKQQALQTMAQLDLECAKRVNETRVVAIEILDEKQCFIATVTAATLIYERYRRPNEPGRQ